MTVYDIFWTNLTSLERVYWVIAIAASTILAIQIIMVFVSGIEFHVSDLSGDAGDAGHAGSGFGHFQLLTPRNLVGFFAIFGWTGLAFDHAGLPVPATLLLSFICGMVMMVLMAAIFFGLSKLQSSGTINIQSAIGQTATVYIPIPANQQGSGMATLTIQGRKTDLEAITTASEKIGTGTMVKVKEIINNKIVVERT